MEEIINNILKYLEKSEWMAHPTAEGVRIKNLITKRDNGLNVTCMLVLLPEGKEVPEHIHKEQDDIIFPMEGKATMWVDGIGFFTLERGVIVQVPKGIKHKIGEVTEELLLYDVFCPALW